MIKLSTDTCRNITIDDLDEIFGFLSSSSVEGVHKPSFYTLSSLIHLYGELSFLYQKNNKIIALSLNLPVIDNNGVYIYVFVVSSEEQGKGIGKKLFNYFLKQFMISGYNKLSLRVLASNTVAHSFWKQMGFRDTPGKIVDTDDVFSEYHMERVL